jgi:hypothetical protein
MGSTYEPLIDWYSNLTTATVIYHENTGHKTLWDTGMLANLFSDYPYVAVTDSDISLSPDTPAGFIEQMVVVAKDFRVDKVGLSIEYRDITNPELKKIIEPIESSYWKHKLQHRKYTIFAAPCDTTFCIVNPLLPFQYNALRIADWPIRHCDWYTDWNNLSAEEQFYMNTADAKVSTTKQHYLQWKTKH